MVAAARGQPGDRQPNPCMCVKARWRRAAAPGQCQLSGGETLITHHPQLPGVPLHNPAARGKRASLEKLCTHGQRVARREFAAPSDAIAGLNTPGPTLGFTSHQASEVSETAFLNINLINSHVLSSRDK